MNGIDPVMTAGGVLLATAIIALALWAWWIAGELAHERRLRRIGVHKTTDANGETVLLLGQRPGDTPLSAAEWLRVAESARAHAVAARAGVRPRPRRTSRRRGGSVHPLLRPRA